MWSCVSYRNQKYDDDWMKIWDARCRKWDMGCEKWEIRCWKWGFWMLTSHFPLPTWHFDKKNWIGSREMGNGIQMRILTTEVSTSEVIFECLFMGTTRKGDTAEKSNDSTKWLPSSESPPPATTTTPKLNSSWPVRKWVSYRVLHSLSLLHSFHLVHSFVTLTGSPLPVFRKISSSRQSGTCVVEFLT